MVNDNNEHGNALDVLVLQPNFLSVIWQGQLWVTTGEGHSPTPC